MTWITTYWGESTTQLIDRQSFNWFHTSCEVLQISHTPWKSNKESFLSGRRAELLFLDLGYPWIMAVYVLGQCRVWFVDLLTEQFLYCFQIEMSRWMLLTSRWKDTPTDSSSRSTHREWSGFHEAWHGHGWLDMVIWLSWRFTGPNMIPLETPKRKDVFLRMLQSLAPHRFLARLLIYNCQISKPCYQSCITVTGCWEPYKCTCYIYIYLYIHIVLGYTQGSWVLPISLCSWICHYIEFDMCKYVYINVCIQYHYLWYSTILSLLSTARHRCQIFCCK